MASLCTYVFRQQCSERVVPGRRLRVVWQRPPGRAAPAQRVRHRQHQGVARAAAPPAPALAARAPLHHERGKLAHSAAAATWNMGINPL